MATQCQCEEVNDGEDGRVGHWEGSFVLVLAVETEGDEREATWGFFGAMAVP